MHLKNKSDAITNLKPEFKGSGVSGLNVLFPSLITSTESATDSSSRAQDKNSHSHQGCVVQQAPDLCFVPLAEFLQTTLIKIDTF